MISGSSGKERRLRLHALISVLFFLIIAIAFNLLFPWNHARRNHKIVMFSDRETSPLVTLLLQTHGFDVTVYSSPIRPKHLDPRWEKVFILEREFGISPQFESISWLDDDLLPDMAWFNILLNNKFYAPVSGGFDYGKRRNQLMSNLLIFRNIQASRAVVRKWIAESQKYTNKTTGVQDQDGINSFLNCNSGVLLCVTHSPNTIHTLGSSANRVDILNRVARTRLWAIRKVPLKTFLLAFFSFLVIRIARESAILKIPRPLSWMSEKTTSQLKYFILLFIFIYILLEYVPTIPGQSTRMTLSCEGASKVRRLGESGCSLGGRWLLVKGVLVYSDALTRKEVSCISSFQRLRSSWSIFVMEHKLFFQLLNWVFFSLIAGVYASSIIDLSGISLDKKLTKKGLL